MIGHYGPLIMGSTTPTAIGEYVTMFEPVRGQPARVLREATLDEFLACRRERDCGPLTAFAVQAIKNGAVFYEVHTD